MAHHLSWDQLGSLQILKMKALWLYGILQRMSICTYNISKNAEVMSFQVDIPESASHFLWLQQHFNQK